MPGRNLASNNPTRGVGPFGASIATSSIAGGVKCSAVPWRTSWTLGNGETIQVDEALSLARAEHGVSPLRGVPDGLLRDYVPIPDRYDEVIGESGDVRPHWRRVIDALNAYDADGLARMRRQTESIVREYGVTYNIPGATKGADRPWALDILPVVISAEDWSSVEAGMMQRARLLNAILADLYGPRRLLHDRVLPPEFVFANPRFLRACDGMPVPQHGHVARYAADLVRGADGRWRVFSDRTQAPAGVGHALENRIVIGRTLPTIMSEVHVRRLAGFFDKLRGMLRGMSPASREIPTIALLTPGALDGAYFEHVLLARYLGFDVVEGEDLAARDNHLYLRTIAGLRQVDVIMRCIDDESCDPLELFKSTPEGVVGLLQTLRARNVAACNAIGSGALECAALGAVLPRLCRHLLGEDLVLPPVKTWWGGDAEQREYIESRFDSLRIAHAFGGTRDAPVEPRQLERSIRQSLYQRWRQQPYEYVAIDAPVPSVVPVRTAKGLVPKGLTIRAYAIGGSNPEHLHVLPGGLGRFIEPEAYPSPVVQAGKGAKDVWVLSDRPVEYVSLLQSSGSAKAIARSPENVSSRLAENLLWLGRYCERTECNVRALRHMLIRCVDEEELADVRLLRGLTNGVPYLFPFEFRQSLGTSGLVDSDVLETVRNAIMDAVYNAESNQTIAGTVISLRRAAWIVRELFSDDDWRVLNAFTHEFLRLQRRAYPPEIGGTLHALDQLVTGLAAFSGLVHENMTREPGRVFIQLGRRIERGYFTLRLLRESTREPDTGDPAQLRSLLAICDSPMTYRARYGPTFELPLVLDLLISDVTNPRSVAYQVVDTAQLLAQLPNPASHGPLRDEERLVAQLNTKILVADVYQLSERNEFGELPLLHGLLDQTIRMFMDVSDALSHRYFIHAARPHPTETVVEPPST